jgi:hypothetical protein
MIAMDFDDLANEKKFRLQKDLMQLPKKLLSSLIFCRICGLSVLLPT